MAKTTSVASIGAALAELGQRVLLVDLDPQACLTFSLGIDPEDLELSVHHVLTKGLDPAEVIIETDDGVDLLPATIELARAEADLLTRTGREHVLRARSTSWPRTRTIAVRLGAARLPAVARRADRRRADRRPGRADPAAVRDAVAPRRGAAARHRPRRTPVHQPRPRGVGRAADVVRRAHQPRADGARDDLRHLRPRGDRAADPEDDQVRRGAGRRSLDPRHQPQQQGCTGLPRGRRRTWSRPRSATKAGDDDAPTAARCGRATGGSRRSSTSLTVLGGGRAGRARRPRRPARRRPAPARRPASYTADATPTGAPPTPPSGDRVDRPATVRTPRTRRPPRADVGTTARLPARQRHGPADRLQPEPPAGLAGRRRRPTTCSAPTWSRAASPTTSSRAPTRSTRRSRWAVGVDDSGVMQYFVRFTQGPTGAAIGFHIDPDQERRAAADARPARHAAVARLHPAGHAGRHRAVELRPGRHQGRRRRLTPAPSRLGRLGVTVLCAPSRRSAPGVRAERRRRRRLRD